MAPATVILYVKELTDWKGHTSKMATRSTRCDIKYIKQAQVEHPLQWKMIASIEHK